MQKHVLILAGGQGTRLWPESRKDCPKQYINLFGTDSLLKMTLKRLLPFTPSRNIFIITERNQLNLSIEHSKGLVNRENIILEPSARNTAACIFLSLLELRRKGAKDDDVIVVLPSDHYIKDEEKFIKTLNEGTKIANKYQAPCLIGIRPDRPQTGYGYLECTEQLSDSSYRLKSFKEKPHLKEAESFLKKGNFLWNAGMFLGPIKVFLQAFQKYSPDIYQYKDELTKGLDSNNADVVYSKLKKQSIDFEIMEKIEELYCVEGDFGWNDLGSWDVMEDLFSQTNGNTFIKENEKRYLDDSSGNIISTTKKNIVLRGLKDYIVVENESTLMIIPKKDAQKIKEISGEFN